MTANRFDDIDEELAGNLTPEPMPVILSNDCCPVHGGQFISMPRNEGDYKYLGLSFKCAWASCLEGR